MAKKKKKPRPFRNPHAADPIHRKAGPHVKSKKTRRQREKKDIEENNHDT